MNVIKAAVDAVADDDAEYVITRDGEPVATLLNYDRHESMVETLDILSDPETMSALAEAEQE